MIRFFTSAVRDLRLDAQAARAIDETLRDWRHEAEGAAGLRRLAIDLRGAGSVIWVVLHTGGGAFTAGDLSWMATRLGLPLAAMVAIIAFNTQQFQVDLARLPFSWWPLTTLAEFAEASGTMPIFLPPILFTAVLFPGSRRRVPWARALLVVATLSLAALLVAQPWGGRVGTGLHYLTFAIERGMPASPSFAASMWPVDVAPIAARVASSALAALAMGACAVVLRPRVAGSWTKSIAAAVVACAGSVVLLGAPAIAQLVWRPALIRSPAWHTWNFALAPLVVAVAAGGAALGAATIFRERPLTLSGQDRKSESI